MRVRVSACARAVLWGFLNVDNVGTVPYLPYLDQPSQPASVLRCGGLGGEEVGWEERWDGGCKIPSSSSAFRIIVVVPVRSAGVPYVLVNIRPVKLRPFKAR